MRKFLVTFCMVILSLVVAHAAPNATIFGGYQYTRFGDSTVFANGLGVFSGTALNANGWNAALTAGFNSWLGIRADVGAAYPNNFDFYTYTFGPELSVHLPIIRPLAHALFGVARVSSSGIVSNDFETIIGGGVDLGHGILAWRVAQVDWMSKGIVNSTNIRISTGLVLRF